MLVSPSASLAAIFVAAASAARLLPTHLALRLPFQSMKTHQEPPGSRCFTFTAIRFPFLLPCSSQQVYEFHLQSLRHALQERERRSGPEAGFQMRNVDASYAEAIRERLLRQTGPLASL